MDQKSSIYDFNLIAEEYDNWYYDPFTIKIDEQEKRAVASLLLPSSTHNKVLEVGCGTGHWTEWLSSHGYLVTGVDVSEKMIRAAKKKKIDAKFIIGDFLKYKIPESYDIVIAITSLEFIQEYRAALKKMISMLNPGGQLLIGTLNKYSYFGIKRKISGTKNPVFHDAHLFSYFEIKSLLKQFGKPVVRGSAFALPCRRALNFAHILEAVGSRLFPVFGNLIVGSVII